MYPVTARLKCRRAAYYFLLSLLETDYQSGQYIIVLKIERGIWNVCIGLKSPESWSTCVWEDRDSTWLPAAVFVTRCSEIFCTLKTAGDARIRAGISCFSGENMVIRREACGEQALSHVICCLQVKTSLTETQHIHRRQQELRCKEVWRERFVLNSSLINNNCWLSFSQFIWQEQTRREGTCTLLKGPVCKT